jgi:heat-inducible transcriptional repressor
MSQNLTEREALILQAVVHTYITEAEPVGSRSIVKRYNLDFSAATVRNVMADLEEAGYLEQLHTSSGRVPTDDGYRYYVDHLMRVQKLTLDERSRIERDLSEQLSDADKVMRQTSQLLALMSQHTGIVEMPDEEHALTRSIELMPVGESRAAMLIADSYGRVRTMVVSVESPLTRDELQTLSNFLNEQLRGVAVENLASALQNRTRALRDQHRELAAKAMALLSMMPVHQPAHFFLEGATQLFEQPEFRDLERAREVFTILEDREVLAEVLRNTLSGSEDGRISVVIGSESQRPGMEAISLVAAPYRVGDERAGVIGIIGPKRMQYSRLTAVVDYTANTLSRFLTRIAG